MQNICINVLENVILKHVDPSEIVLYTMYIMKESKISSAYRVFFFFLVNELENVSQSDYIEQKFIFPSDYGER